MSPIKNDQLPQKINSSRKKYLSLVYICIGIFIVFSVLFYLPEKSRTKDNNQEYVYISSIGTKDPSSKIKKNQYLCVQVEGNSMEGILKSGEYVWMKEIQGENYELQRNDIVIIRQASYSMDMIKRIGGVPGDYLSVHNLDQEEKYYTGQFFSGAFLIKINNVPVTLANGEPIIYSQNKKSLFSLYVGKIKENSFLLIGNQQGGTMDSSRFGLIGGNEIVGKMIDHSNYDDFCKKKKLEFIP